MNAARVREMDKLRFANKKLLDGMKVKCGVIEAQKKEIQYLQAKLQMQWRIIQKMDPPTAINLYMRAVRELQQEGVPA